MLKFICIFLYLNQSRTYSGEIKVALFCLNARGSSLPIVIDTYKLKKEHFRQESGKHI